MISDQISLFSNQQPIETLEIEVPELPSVIRYTDDFTEKDHSFSSFDLDTWTLISNGSKTILKFDRYNLDPCLKKLIKVFAADRLLRYSVSSTRLWIDGLVHFNTSEIGAFIESSPESARQLWDSLRARERPGFSYDGLKSLLKFVAERRLAAWTPLYLPFISASLPLPHHDKFATIRSGDAFISIEEEARLVRWIYEKAASSQSLCDKDLIDAALIICNYQFAMRPKQIGLLRRRDCRVLQLGDGRVSVHLNFRMIKQRTASAARTPLPRKIKREWAIIFSEIFNRGESHPGDAYLFGYVTSASVSTRLGLLIREILGSERSANDLRHSGAMRQVDAGASAEDLAEFMGHSSLETGLVYFDASPTQAERVNQALGISETYQRLATLGKERFISMDELAKLKGEQQIAGVPHGIAIAGIGGCKTGQPACPYNPITACYGCPKFMPVGDIEIHKKVLSDFREVVKFFYDASRGESESPAYLQLKRTISEVNCVIDELGTQNG
jgi:integrase